VADPPRVVALLLNWRQPDLTLQCLQDLLLQRLPGLAVVVMDNGSGDDSAARLAAAAAAGRARGVEALAFATNLGFAAAMNRGIERARALQAEFVLVLNNDLRLPPGALQPLVQTLANDARVAAVAPTVLFPDGRVWAEGGRLGFFPNTLRLCRHGRLPTPTAHGPEARAFVPGACVLFRCSDLDAVGGFDERYFMYWEDVDLCRRLARRGRVVLWLPWVRVTHAAGSSSGGSRSPLRKYLMAKNGVRFLRAHGTAAQWAALLLLDLPSLPLLLLRSPRQGWAKACGLAAGLLGRRSSAADVERWRRAR
jgi:hypothetical protein